MTPTPEKAAPIPADIAATILITALREYGQEDNRAGEAENMGRHAAVRGMMVRLGLYPEFCKALDADATDDEVSAILADREARPFLPDIREERIRAEAAEDERDRLYAETRDEALSGGDNWHQANEAAKWLWRMGAMLPADRARARQGGNNG